MRSASLFTLRKYSEPMGLNRWRQIGRRLAQMDRAELRDRLRQEFAKRQDAALVWFASDFGRSSRDHAAGKANFFFSADSLDSILALLRQRLPGQAERIVQQAEQIRQHRFDLLGYSSLDYSGDIDWHRDAVHEKRAPRKAFYKINYLDYAEVGDSKVTWELNRHQHMVTLAKACRLTNDRRFADEILWQWQHWQAANPYPTGINWASSLEVAFRSLSWLWTYHLLQGTPGLPDFREEWLRSWALHGRHIERYLSTYFSPNTHLLGEGVALFFLGVLCPELPAAERWKALGWQIILQEAEKQVRADGFHFEQSTYYHVYALDFFLHSAVLAGANSIPTPKSLEDTIEKMLTALCLLGRGGVPRYGDDDGGRLFDPRRNRGEHLQDPLATGAILFQRGDFKTAAGSLREETLWLLGSEGVRQWDGLEKAAVSTESAVLRDSGFYLLAAQEETQLVVDAGPLGTQSGGHGHADALSVCLHSEKHSLLIDPGTFEYIGPGNERDLFRGTAMHNTLQVDGAYQAEPTTPFSWRRLTQTRVEQWIQGKNFDLLVASHDGYERLEAPATHRRSVISLRNGIYLVRDVIEGQGKHRLDIRWHLGQDLELVEEGLFRSKGASQGLALLPVRGHGWAQEVRKESWSPAYGQKAPMTVVNFTADAALPAEFAVLLVVLKEVRSGNRNFVRIEDPAAGSESSGYRYADDDAEYSFVFGKRGKSWRKNSLLSDAGFVYWKRNPKSTDEHLILSGGSFVQVEGGIELHCTRPVQWAEVMIKDGVRTIFSSDEAAFGERLAEIQQSEPASPRAE
jgi:hypothetical protein